ncbi:MAG: hypothetical protein ACXWZM_05405 [Solirubrobacterales bacterium]
MDPLGIVRELWRHKIYLTIVVVVALLFAILSAFKVTPSGLEKRSLQVGAASSQVLVDSPGSALVAGASVGTFDALSTRAQIYGQYLSSLEARAKIAKLTGVPPGTIATAGPFSTDVAQNSYSGQSSEDRANQLVDQGAPNRLVFTAQEGVPIISVDSQAPTANRAAKLAVASFITLKRYVRKLKSSEEYKQTLKTGPNAEAKAALKGVTVRQLGTPEGGTIGGANDKILMILAFITVFLLGCAAIIILPRALGRWRSLDEIERGSVPARLGGSNGAANGAEETAQSAHRARGVTVPGNGGQSRHPAEATQDTRTGRSAPSP